MRNHVQPLETRRLLALNPFGPETVVPVDNRLAVHSTALAVAGDGSFLVASHDGPGDDEADADDLDDVLAVEALS